MKDYKVIFNSGLSIDDTIEIIIKASSEQDALELVLIQNPEYIGFNNYVTKNA